MAEIDRLHGLLPVVPTALRQGEIDRDGCRAIAEWLTPHVHGLTLLGSLGEGPSLAVRARQEAAEAFIEGSASRLVIVLGIGASAIEDSIALSRHGEQRGVDALFLPAPTYYAAGEHGLLEYFTRVADATSLPIVLYDNPYITGFRLSPSFMAELTERAPSFRYVKVTDRKHGKVEEIVTQTPLVPFSGSDDLMHHHVLTGARGAMTAVPCVAPRASRRWWDLVEAGDADGAFGIFTHSMAALALEMMSEGDHYPVLAKECLRLLGVLESSDVLPPLIGIPESRVDYLRRALEAAGEKAIAHA
jgi:4-hydroxy-tetrahydrodipicolinate synthase